MNNLLQYKDFLGSVEVSVEDECLIGKVLNIDGVIVFAGENFPEIKHNFEEVIDEYLQMCVERGITPQKPYKGSFNVRITPELHKKAHQRALTSNLSLNQLITQALTNELDREENTVNINLTLQKQVEFTANYSQQISDESVSFIFGSNQAKHISTAKH